MPSDQKWAIFQQLVNGHVVTRMVSAHLPVFPLLSCILFVETAEQCVAFSFL